MPEPVRQYQELRSGKTPTRVNAGSLGLQESPGTELTSVSSEAEAGGSRGRGFSLLMHPADIRKLSEQTAVERLGLHVQPMHRGVACGFYIWQTPPHHLIWRVPCRVQLAAPVDRARSFAEEC